MQTNPAAEQNKNVEWLQSPWNQSGRWRKCLRWDAQLSAPMLEVGGTVDGSRWNYSCRPGHSGLWTASV